MNSTAGDIIRPIVGLATNQFIPLTDWGYTFVWVFIPLELVTLLFWTVLLVAFVRDRHYEDPNNLLILSFSLADIVCTTTSLHTTISFAIDHGYSRGYIGCVWESYILSVGFCASGMSVVVIALDRYLLMCHGYFASWTKTACLLLICWFASLVGPALVIFPTLPDSIFLANGGLCYPNYTSQDPLIKEILLGSIFILLLAILTTVVCYGNVFYKYNSTLLRKQKQGAKATAKLPEKSKKLLYKLCILTANYLITFTPLVVSLIVMMATQAEIPDAASEVLTLIFEIGLSLNPLLIYLLDAKMKLSVNELFGIRRLQTVPKKKEQGEKIQLKDLPSPIAAPIVTAPILQDTVILDTLKIQKDFKDNILLDPS